MSFIKHTFCINHKPKQLHNPFTYVPNIVAMASPSNPKKRVK